MLTVTKPALDRLSRRLVRKEAADGMALRFTRRDGGWTLRLDQESAGDTAFTHDGRKVLLLDEVVSKAMENMTLDIRKSAQRSGLRLYRNKRRRN
ncbi:MAG TPA: hypothetical protein VMY42_26725 [Thermoguttaceae bacterium]|nr:hypothetical protein [Thermoguttaceae bacterium]